MSEKKPYKCNWLVRHNDKEYPADSTDLKLTDDDAANLKALGAISEITSASEDGSSTNKDVSIFEKLLKAMAKLEPENTEHFNNDGKPSVKALEKLVGESVSGEQRDEVWEAVGELAEELKSQD